MFTTMQYLPARRGLRAALGMAACLGLWGCSNATTNASNKPTTAAVVRRDIVGYIPLPGQIVSPPGTRADIMPAYRAPVERVYATVGQKVNKGETLLTLSFPSAQAAYEQARQDVKSAEIAYANAAQQYDALLRAARKQLEAARAAERAARDANKPAPSEGDAPEGGASVSVTTAPDLEQAISARKDAERAVLDAEAEKRTALAPYKAQLDQAREAYQKAKPGEKMSYVRAPITGVLLAINARPGEEIGQDAKVPVATVVDLGALQVQAEVRAEQAAWVKRDTPITLTFEGIPNKTFDGTVAKVLPPAVTQKPNAIAVIEFKNDQGLVKPGMKVTAASIRAGEVKNVLAVPSAAVKMDGSGKPTVEVQQGNEWLPRIIEIGLSDGQYTHIRSGLNEGETVRVAS